MINSNTPVKWLFYGDSITQGSLHTYGHRSYPELFSERVRYELNRPMDIVINTAFSGFTTKDLIESFDWGVAKLEPAVVFIMIGMNDSLRKQGISTEDFKNNILRLVSLVNDINATVILQTTCPVLAGRPGSESYTLLPVYMEIIRDIAIEKNIALIDHTLYWERNSKYHSQWMNNLIHPNALGHRVFAKYIFQFFDIDDDLAPSSKLPLIRNKIR